MSPTSQEWIPLRTVVVGRTAEVLHDTHTYSMAPDAIGLPATLWLYRERRPEHGGMRRPRCRSALRP